MRRCGLFSDERKPPHGTSLDRHLGVELSQLAGGLLSQGPEAGPLRSGRWLGFQAERLNAFLSGLPAGQRMALGFRDPSWHCAETCAVLEAHGAAFRPFEPASPDHRGG